MESHRGDTSDRAVAGATPDGHCAAQPSNAPWLRRRFGPHLRKYEQRSRATTAVPTAKALQRVRDDGGVIGVFLVPLLEAGMRHANQDCGHQLRQLYERLLTDEGRLTAENRWPSFEVVQVCFAQRPPNVNFGRNRAAKDEYESRLATVPWFALPFDDIERSVSTPLFAAYTRSISTCDGCAGEKQRIPS